MKTVELPDREVHAGHLRREGDKDRNPYSCAIAAGTLLLAEEMVRLEKRKKRKQKKLRVLGRKRAMLKEAYPKLTADIDLDTDAGKLLSPRWSRAESIEFLIDLAFTRPFAPYELRYKNSHLTIALENVARLLHLGDENVIRIRHNQRKAFKVYRYVKWKKSPCTASAVSPWSARWDTSRRRSWSLTSGLRLVLPGRPRRPTAFPSSAAAALPWEGRTWPAACGY
ncbi:MAG: hypothetical protein ACYSRP_02260 [Planctomycetota bacterium]